MQGVLDALVKRVLLCAHPVGCVYMSLDSTSPEVLFGGTWEQIEDRFLLAAGSTYAAGSTGGEANHNLTMDELPNVKGYLKIGSGSTGSSAATGWAAFRESTGVFTLDGECMYDIASNTTDAAYGGSRYQNVRMSFGSNAAHNNMPPYLTVFVWRRTA